MSTSLIILSIFLGLFASRVWAQDSNTRQAYPLSRQDSILVDKYARLSDEWKGRGDEKEASRYQNEIALIYWNHNQYQKAITHYERSLELNRDLDNENGIAMIHNNLGMLYSDVGQYQTSYDYFQKTLAARRANKEKVGMISALINLSVVLNNLKRYEESVTHLTEALDLARELNDPDQMKSCYAMLSETHEKAGNSEESIYYFGLYRTFHEKVQEEKIQKTRAEAEAAQLRAKLAEAEKRNKELELQQKEQEIAEYDSTQKNLLESLSRRQLEVEYFRQQQRINELEATEAKERQRLLDAELEKAELIRNMFIAGFLIVIVFSFFLYRNYRAKKRINKRLEERNEEVLRQNEEIASQRDRIFEQRQQLQEAFEQIEQKNLQITQSINYAKRIQEAMLTREPSLENLLPESFVLLKPRDIVSGDFYWYAKKKEHLLIAAVDCTGHGVPGAFMSMIGNNILDTVVNAWGQTKPSMILKALHEGVVDALSQQQTENRDGMDMALLSINLEKQEMYFAGANRPLLLVRDGKLEVIKGDRNAIGGHHTAENEEDVLFTNHTIKLDRPLQFYIFSDGYPDQFGGERDKKYMIKRLKQRCLEWADLPQAEQKQQFDQEIETWMQHTFQVDDILLIGGRIQPSN